MKFIVKALKRDEAEKYKLSDREKSEVKWLLFDLGHPMRGDRGYMLDEEDIVYGDRVTGTQKVLVCECGHIIKVYEDDEGYDEE